MSGRHGSPGPLAELVRRRAAAALLLSGAVAASWACRVQADGCADTYQVAHLEGAAPLIDGILEGTEWPAARWEAGLSFPWRERAAPDTAFSVLSDGSDLYFAFRVSDDDVVIAEGDPQDEALVARGDRVELFLARDAGLDEYYSIEIDPLGRVLDYQASFYRQFDRGWDCPGLEVAAVQRPGGYDVEGRIPGRALGSMGLALPSGEAPLLAGVFRGEFSHREDQAPHESWISWVRPRVARPDFHVPSSFGCFRFDGRR